MVSNRFVIQTANKLFNDFEGAMEERAWFVAFQIKFGGFLKFTYNWPVQQG